MTCVNACDPLVRVTGRVELRKEEAVFYWPASYALVRFRGARIECRVRPHVVYGCNFLGVCVDGLLSRVPLSADMNDTEQVFVLAENLETDRDHTLMLFKMADSAYFYALRSFTCDGQFVSPGPRERLRLEFYGDSVTSGYCVEAEDYMARSDPSGTNGSLDNAWWSYAWQCGRLLGAEIHTVSQGGIAVRTRTGYFHDPDGMGMDEAWDRLSYVPEAGPYSAWDFSRFIPHAVIFALGQNDHHDAVRGDDSISPADPAVRLAWKEAYKKIARGAASHYPKGTPLLFITTLIMHDREWDDAVGETADELRAEGLNARRFLFRRAGRGTPGHPRVAEQREMALELAEELKGLLS